MTMNYCTIYYSCTMVYFICISVVVWGLCADGHDGIKKEFGSSQLFLPLHDLLNSYRSNVLNNMTTFTRNATTSHSAHACSKSVAPCSYGNISFSNVQRVVDIKRYCAQTSRLFCRLPFQLLLKSYWAISRIMVDETCCLHHQGQAIDTLAFR
jgi:hypothetical protein